MASRSRTEPVVTQRVVVMRHGERRDAAPDAPAEGDPPLTEEGKREVAQAARKLKAIFGEEAARKVVLVSSPFTRCVQTAEALQKYGVGSEKPLVFDCSLSEVFGPTRIKATHAPALPRRVLDVSVGSIPRWGESIQQAHERFNASLLRIADRFGGTEPVMSRSGGSDGTNSDQGPMSVPAAVTARAQGRPNRGGPGVTPARQPQGRGQMATAFPYEYDIDLDLADLGVPDSAVARPIHPPQDVVLVTHGDALSAVLGRYYPARTLYEAAFLSFLVMKRYGLRNTVFHLDASAGANWIVDGVDKEPHDPDYVQAIRTPTPSESDYDEDAFQDPDDFLDDLEDGDGHGGGGVPHSSINRRVLAVPPATSRRTSVTKPQQGASGAHRVVVKPTATVPAMQQPEMQRQEDEFEIFNYGGGVGGSWGGATPETLAHHRPHPPLPHHMTGSGQSGAHSNAMRPTALPGRGSTSSSSGAVGIGAPSRAPALATPVAYQNPRAKAVPPDSGGAGPPTNATSSSEQQTVLLPRVHPKAIEGCSRTQLPMGTPLQSSASTTISGTTQKEAHDQLTGIATTRSVGVVVAVGTVVPSSATNSTTESHALVTGLAITEPSAAAHRSNSLEEGKKHEEEKESVKPFLADSKSSIGHSIFPTHAVEKLYAEQDDSTHTRDETGTAQPLLPPTTTSAADTVTATEERGAQRTSTTTTTATTTKAAPTRANAVPATTVAHEVMSRSGAVPTRDATLSQQLLNVVPRTSQGATFPPDESERGATAAYWKTSAVAIFWRDCGLRVSFLLRVLTVLAQLVLVTTSWTVHRDAVVYVAVALAVEVLQLLVLILSLKHPHANALRRAVEQCQWQGLRRRLSDAGPYTRAAEPPTQEQLAEESLSGADAEDILCSRGDSAVQLLQSERQSPQQRVRQYGCESDEVAQRSDIETVASSDASMAVSSQSWGKVLRRQLVATTAKASLIVVASLCIAATAGLRRDFTMPCSLASSLLNPLGCLGYTTCFVVNVLRGAWDEGHLGRLQV